MKVSLNWAQQLSNVNLNPVGTDDLVQKIGAQLGAVEEVIQTGSKYNGIVVARVVSCQKHPNADKLSVCLIDDGGVTQGVERNGAGHVQVVCGAPNVREGLTVAWLPPGTTVPSTYGKDPFILGARELRGVISNGMIASPQEVALSDDHGGILEINVQEVGEELAKPGTPFKKLYGLDDVIIDIENKMFTHRPDCFGILGVAREITGIQHQAFKSPEWYLSQPTFDEVNVLSLSVHNEVSELVPRFMAVAMNEVKVMDSPIWLQAGLGRVGIKSVNNVVDVTNYLMYVTGQPLHAYDYDKVAARSNNGAVLAARLPKDGETVKLLNGKTLQPRDEAVMIATDKELIGVGGVMGGADTEVDENTKNIIIECANFNMYSIRRTSMAHGLFTDAVTRFNKGQSPHQNDRVIAKAMELMNGLAGARQASNVINNVGKSENITTNVSQLKNPILVSAEFINQRLGLQLTPEEITSLLNNVEFNVKASPAELAVQKPFWRTDIAIPEDIVEEVGRLYGFEKLPLELPKRMMTPTKSDAKLAHKQKLRQTLANLGANEVLTYSFVHGNLIEKAGQNKDLAFKLSNALSPDLQYYRMSLTPSLLNQVHPNIKAGHDSFSLFEINKTHINTYKNSDNGVPKELENIALVTASKSKQGDAYYQARAYLDQLAESLGVKLRYDAVPESLDYPVIRPFERTRSAIAGVEGTDILLGIIGEYKQSVAQALKLPGYCAGFEIGLEAVMAIKPHTKYTPLSRYPNVSQDICLEVDSSLTYSDLSSAFDKILQSELELDQIAEWKPIDIYQPDRSAKKRITYRVTVTSYERTLTENIVTEILSNIAASLHESVGATRI